MKHLFRIAMIAAALALAAAPALALAGPSQSGQEHGKGKGPQYETGSETPGPKAPLPEKAKAYGVYCREESKKHVKGEKGTPFSQCVTAMARAANNEKLTAREACKGMSKKHVKGEKGTPFSRCVTAAAKLHKAESS
jgi:hypothetical protein